MKVNELQIGDWVYDSKRSQFPMQVVAIFKDGDLYLDFEGNEGDVWECEAEEVEPIPITAEILEKNGIENTVGTTHEWEDGDKSIDIILRWEVCRIQGDKGGCKCHIIYVHELQQALRLCGIDKEIKL